MNPRAALAAIDPEFLVPAAKHAMDIRGPVTLRVARLFNNRATKSAATVTSRRAPLPGTPGVSAMIHEPEVRSASRGALLWTFGGGLISGSAARVNDVAFAFASALGVIVVVPDYRLAPGHPYPAAIDDCYAALMWLIDNAAGLDIDPARIIIGGESAGGGLTAALAQRTRDAGVPLLLQVLVAPMLDDRSSIEAESRGESFMVWTTRSNRFAWESYLGHPITDTQDERPYAVPARTADLAGLPPALISVGEADLFHREGVAYANRLARAGVATTLTTVPGAHHGWELLAPNHPRVLAVQAARIEAMRRALETR